MGWFSDFFKKDEQKIESPKEETLKAIERHKTKSEDESNLNNPITQNIITKHCESCGNKINNPFWSALFSTDYIIFLKNEMIVENDTKNHVIHLSNGEKLDYMFAFAEDIVSMPFFAKIHLLCSLECEDKFLSNNAGGMLSADVYKKTHIFSYREQKVFKPSALPIKNCMTTLKKCEICNDEYPDFVSGSPQGWEKKWMAMPIISETKEYVTNKAQPQNIDLNKFEVIVSGVNDRSPNGNYYGYEIDHSRASEKSLCSNDCAYTYSIKNNCIITMSSVLDKDRLGVITPAAEDCNENMGNPIPHRPQFLGYL